MPGAHGGGCVVWGLASRLHVALGEALQYRRCHACWLVLVQPACVPVQMPLPRALSPRPSVQCGDEFSVPRAWEADLRLGKAKLVLLLHGRYSVRRTWEGVLP